MEPRITIVIPAHDEASYLPATLAAIDRQTFRDFETIVVANACSDATYEIAARHCRALKLDSPGQSAAQNAGAQAAKGEILLFLDADVVLPPTALELVAAKFGSGTFEARPSKGRFWYRAVYAFRNFVHSTGLYRSHLGGILCPRELFLRIGGFDEQWEPRSNRDLIRRLLRSGSFCYLRAPVTVSTRRYESWGVWKLSRFWLIAFLRSIGGRPRSKDYDAIR